MTAVQPWRQPLYNNAAIAQQEAVCFELRLRGMSVRAIAAYVAEHHGWPLSKSTVHVRIEAAGKDATSELAEQVRALELERVDRMWALLLATINDPKVRHPLTGEVLLDPDSGRPVRDPAVVFAGVDRLDKIMARRAKYVAGLEQTGPVEVVVTDAASERERLAVQELVNEARAMAAAAAATNHPQQQEEAPDGE